MLETTDYVKAHLLLTSIIIPKKFCQLLYTKTGLAPL